MREGHSAADMHRVGEWLASAVGRSGSEMDLLVAISTHWEGVVGGRVASHARPLRVEENVLLVTADSGTWVTQMKVLSSEVGRRLSEMTGGRVAGIRVLTKAP